MRENCGCQTRAKPVHILSNLRIDSFQCSRGMEDFIIRCVKIIHNIITNIGECSQRSFLREIMQMSICLLPVSYTHLRAHETDSYLVCRLLLEKKKKNYKHN